MTLIQNLAQGQEEPRALVNKIHQDGYNCMKQTIKDRDQVINQPLLQQEVSLVERTPFKMDATPRVQQRLHQPRHGGPHKQDAPKRHFTKINMSLAQVL